MKSSSLLNARRRALCLALPALAAVSLSACGDEKGGSVSAAPAEREFGIPERQNVSAQAVRQHARGFTVGQLLSANEVFVFFDPKCPHCAMFWLDTEALRQKVKFTWIPVALMGPGSAGAGAEILEAEDKVRAMSAHAAKIVIAMRAGQRPPLPSSDSGKPEDLANIARNSRLLKSFGADSVPYVVAVNGDGAVVYSNSGAQASAVAAALKVAQQP